MIHNRWAGETVAVIASGPSAGEAAIDLLAGRAKVIAVNDSWRLCPWADMLYAADQRWWKHHEYVTEFKGERWSQQQGTIDWPEEAKRAGIRIIQSKNEKGISFDPERIHTGMNSSFQALNLAILQGASRVLLIGLDLAVIGGRTHWFGTHPGKLERNSPYASFRKEFMVAAPQIERAGIEVVNCSLLSTLACFPKMTVAEAVA